MFISGFTIIRNAFVNGYPVVDEMVVSVGNSRRWYAREMRVIRNDADIRSYKDAQGFRHANGGKLLAAADVFNFDDYDSLELFQGTHPAVMQPRVARQNWPVQIDISKKRFFGSRNFRLL
ncbi:hypothetical protein [Hymenobacter canadensis]|uniref:Uncharacterized protein n=1 Tax=Hymenobacter canadensis TaxID=2999067 RepID=A0ABY7LNQ2_9BACT|nr:hypothetical protein [Hymenobacter canadensis]WBA42051.1 hypothetical protein O3303_00490 [Hymenobacter canadensis]